MTSITIEISGPAAEKLRSLAEAEQRSEVEIVRDPLEAYAPSRRPLPRAPASTIAAAEAGTRLRRGPWTKLIPGWEQAEVLGTQPV
jgi:predicted transcriptional regulator